MLSRKNMFYLLDFVFLQPTAIAIAVVKPAAPTHAIRGTMVLEANAAKVNKNIRVTEIPRK